MSPKSRGRPPSRRPAKKRQHPVHELSAADRAVYDARRILHGDDALSAELWASGRLGEAWVSAPPGAREAEHLLVLGMVERATARPGPYGTAALAALRRVAEPREEDMLDDALDLLEASQPRPTWADAPGWVPTTAYRSLDVWGAGRVLFVEFAHADGSRPHCLMADIAELSVRRVVGLILADVGAAFDWDERGTAAGLPLEPLVELPVAEVLADLADAMRSTDMTWPRQDDPDYVELRALSWTRCRAHLQPFGHVEPVDEARSRELVEAFTGSGVAPDDDVTRSLAELFLDYGDGYLPVRPLGWSPGSVELFLGDWLVRKAVLDAEQRAALPDVLRHWVRFALTRRGVAPKWIDIVVTAVDEHRGVDLTDEEAAEEAIRALNAENLARRLESE